MPWTESLSLQGHCLAENEVLSLSASKVEAVSSGGEGKGYCIALNHVFSLVGVNLAASRIIGRMFSSFKKSYPPHEVNPSE